MEAEAMVTETVWNHLASRPDMARPARKKKIPEWAKQILMGAAGGIMIGLLLGAGFLGV